MESGQEYHQAQSLDPTSNEDYNAAEILLMLEVSNLLEATSQSLHSLTDEDLRPASKQDEVHVEPEALVFEPEFPNHVHGVEESLSPPEMNLTSKVMESGPKDHKAHPLDPISNEDYNATEILLMVEDSNPLKAASQSLHSLTCRTRSSRSTIQP
ncbi:unnamed protein product [Ilex paraguariensis]|uniref:Uncharacterized protein n=1 Tax=Ilex paraguariensis TaxID=185542 RepID=A0ABC8V4S3_9AQUA